MDEGYLAGDEMSINLPSVAVGIVFFNKADQTVECIHSFSKAGVPVYVLNNGSDAESAESVRGVCGEISNVIYIHSIENLGCGGGRNHLINAIKEDWIFFVDNDITVKEDYWLDNVAMHLQHLVNVDVLAPIIHNIWDGSRVRPVRLGVNEGKATFSDITSEYTNVFPGGGSLVRRKLFERLGVYDAELLAFEDFELALRAMRSGQEICVKHVYDLNLLHDHRFVTKQVDREAVQVRYNADRVGAAHDKVERVYGVSFDKNYKEWLEQQIKELTDPSWVKTPVGMNAKRGIRWEKGRSRRIKNKIRKAIGLKEK